MAGHTQTQCLVTLGLCLPIGAGDIDMCPDRLALICAVQLLDQNTDRKAGVAT